MRTRQGSKTSVSTTPIQNPLEISAVLSVLFSKCSVSDLRTVRLVSKLWLEKSLPMWRKSAVVVVSGQKMGKRLVDNEHYYKKELRYHHDHEPTPGEMSISQFVDFILQPGFNYEGMPYRKFRLCMVDFSVKGQEKMCRFWEVCGPTMTHLKIKEYDVRDCRELRAVIFSRTPKLENLILKLRNCMRTCVSHPLLGVGDDGWGPNEGMKFLKISVQCRNGSQWSADTVETHPGIPFSWEEVFRNFPNLETLNVNYQTVTPRQHNLFQLLNSLRDARSRGHLSKLQNLRISEPFPGDTDIAKTILTLLVDSKLPLKALRIYLGFEVTVTEKDFLHFLDAYRGSLQNLNISRLHHVSRNQFNSSLFPLGVMMESLHQIVVSDLQCVDMEFLKFTPNLQTLRLSSRPGHSDIPLQTSIVRCTDLATMNNVRCTELKDFSFEYLCTPTELKHLTKWMPNVEVLKIPLNNDTFHIVCLNWRNLRDLTIIEQVGGHVDDTGVTGRSGNRQNKCLTNITYLRNLRCLRMAYRKYDGPYLTQTSVTDGFLHLQYLQHLEISAQLRDAAINRLLDGIPNCTLLRLVRKKESGGGGGGGCSSKSLAHGRKCSVCKKPLMEARSWDEITNIWYS